MPVYTFRPGTSNAGQLKAVDTNYNSAIDGANATISVPTSVYVGQRLGGGDYSVYVFPMSFDTTALTPTEDITDVEFKLKVLGTDAEQDFRIEVYYQDFGASISISDWPTSFGTLLAFLDSQDVVPNALNSFIISNAFLSSVKHDDSTDLIVVSRRQRLKQAPDAGVGERVLVANANSALVADRPTLIVTTSAPAITGDLLISIPPQDLFLSGSASNAVQGDLLISIPPQDLFLSALNTIPPITGDLDIHIPAQDLFFSAFFGAGALFTGNLSIAIPAQSLEFAGLTPVQNSRALPFPQLAMQIQSAFRISFAASLPFPIFNPVMAQGVSARTITFSSTLPFSHAAVLIQTQFEPTPDQLRATNRDQVTAIYDTRDLESAL